MRIIAIGHWGGDPGKHCEQVTVAVESPEEVSDVTALGQALNSERERVQLIKCARMLQCSVQRSRLLDLIERIEAEDAAELVGC